MKKGLKIFFIILLLILCILGGLYIYYEYTKEIKSNAYLASETDKVILYDENYKEVKQIFRGQEITTTDKEYNNENIIYKKVYYNDNIYYVRNSNLVDNKEDVVKEKEAIVNVPVTVYKDLNIHILGFLKRGEKVEIIGYDKLTDGIVNMYKIKYEDSVGYVYSKYLTNKIDDSDIESINNIHKDRKFSYELYGGYASELDYHPHEKANFKDNVMPEETYTLYINASSLSGVDDYIAIAKQTKVNAFVVDIYDGYMAYESEVAKVYSPTAYKTKIRTKDEYKVLIDKLKDNGFYVIGRIVAFNNSHFAIDNPDDAISKNGKGAGWVSAYSRHAWEYNVALAIEAINWFGFNEIQYDYVRFPEASYSWSKSGVYDFKNKYNESKGEAIQNFLLYATDKIHEAGAYISADVFGEAAYTYVTAYGQYWPAISNIVDVISAMPYPDHFNTYDFGFKVPVWTKPYELMSAWAKYAQERQKEILTPAKVRTWIQAYNTIREPYIVYGAKEVSDQIKGLYDSGLNNGFITWNAMSSKEKYRSIKNALNESYR